MQAPDNTVSNYNRINFRMFCTLLHDFYLAPRTRSNREGRQAGDTYSVELSFPAVK